METLAILMALVTVNVSLMFCTFGSQMDPGKTPTPAVRLKPLSIERQVLPGSTVTVTGWRGKFREIEKFNLKNESKITPTHTIDTFYVYTI